MGMAKKLTKNRPAVGKRKPAAKKKLSKHDAAWAKEINRRIDDIESGKVKPVPWAAVSRSMGRRIAQVRRARGD